MIKKMLPIVALISCNMYAMDKMHEHKSLNNDEYKTITHSSDANNMFAEFTSSLSNMQIVVVDVNGMVCDFCARGIEKAFLKDTKVKKIDVDLENGKVVIAYSLNKKITFKKFYKRVYFPISINRIFFSFYHYP